ncbi:MAG TPA: sigma 54-interacting transcriptional regulator [Chthoniobacterales bacterium]|nr:sigma 54-interacting transcriptional regulator [Chthoniobacterales bacterium]
MKLEARKHTEQKDSDPCQRERVACIGSWSFRPDLTFEYWSPETFVCFGLDPSNGVPTLKEMLAAVHPDDRGLVAATAEKMARDGINLEITYRIIHPDRGLRFMRTMGEALFENGRVTQCVGHTVDITEQHELLRELHRRQETTVKCNAYLVQAQALSHTGCFGWNMSTGDLYWSDETFRILNYPRTIAPALELVFRRVHPDDLRLVQQTIERAGETDHMDFEHRLLMPDASVKHVHVVARRFETGSGDMEFVGSIMDVSGSRKALQEIKALKDELYKENIVLRDEINRTSLSEDIVGTSSAWERAMSRAAKVAPTDSTVLIMGETGTGKELVARAIRKRSKRADQVFVSVNCAAIPSSLIASELFGHEKGAFTGAVQRRLGRFELAEGGTLFLDEIGDLPAETQIALLRVLQEREFERVGGAEVLRADVRVIAATSRDLQNAIAGGAFRSDLYYRLNVFPIELPPLRERKEDIPLLINYFVDRYAKRAGKRIKHIQKKTLEMLQEYSWPGNVRELQNVIERSIIITETDEFSIDKSWVANEPQSSGADARGSNERQRIEAALAQSSGKISGANGAAALLDIPPSTLESKIRSLKINKFQFKGA